MAGQTPLLIEADGRNHSVPDHFETVNYFINGTTANTDDVYLHICERETVVDSVIIRSPSTDTNFAGEINKCATGESVAQGTRVANFSGGITANTNLPMTIATAENIVEAGSALGLDITTSGGTDLLITMRIRTRVSG